jgi:hypothetical protein
MSTEWDDLIKDLAILNGWGNKDQGYKELCASTALTNLWSIVESKLNPTTDNLLRLRELMEEYETEYYNECVRPKILEKMKDQRSDAEKRHTYEMTKEIIELKVRVLKLEAALEKCKCGLYQTCDICKKYQERQR